MFWECPVVISLWTHVNLVLSSLLRIDWSVNPSLCLLNDDSGLCINSMQKRMLFAGFTAAKKTIIQNWFAPQMCRKTYWIRSLLQIVTCECATAWVGGARPSTIDAWQCFLLDIRDCIKEWLLCFYCPSLSPSLLIGPWDVEYVSVVLFCYILDAMLCYVLKKKKKKLLITKRKWLNLHSMFTDFFLLIYAIIMYIWIIKQLNKRKKRSTTLNLCFFRATNESLYLPLFLSLDKLAAFQSLQRAIAIEFHLTAIWLKLPPWSLWSDTITDCFTASRWVIGWPIGNNKGQQGTLWSASFNGWAAHKTCTGVTFFCEWQIGWGPHGLLHLSLEMIVFIKAQLQDSYCPCGPTRTPHQSIW